MKAQTPSNDILDAYIAYAIYADSFKNKTNNKKIQIQGLRALIRYLDIMVELGQGSRCSVTVSFDGGEPSRVVDASERRAKALAKIARLSE
jgi:sulfatase maturation enzyme AslB (radical SAM superfamily)